jgi:ribonucleotide monophosphatase NagD (HAD superfamily)
LAQVYAEQGGRVLMSGKPHAGIYDLAHQELARLAPGVSRAQVLAVGDGLATDLAGAQAQGLEALFIAGGVHGDSLQRGGRLDLAAVEALLAEGGVTARFAAAALR